ncbi:MAG: hypothetical protein AAF449_02145 [Myxococcota bacterium]
MSRDPKAATETALSPPFMAGAFDILLDDGFTVVELEDPVELHVDEWDVLLKTELKAKGRSVELQGAPYASWALARLNALCARSFTEGPIELVDDAVYVLDFVVHERARPVAKIQVQGGMIGVGLLGVQARALDRRLVDAFTQAMVADPQTCAVSSVRVRDPDWLEAPSDYCPRPDKDRFNTYGWDGHRFLGHDNVKAAGV